MEAQKGVPVPITKEFELLLQEENMIGQAFRNILAHRAQIYDSSSDLVFIPDVYNFKYLSRINKLKRMPEMNSVMVHSPTQFKRQQRKVFKVVSDSPVDVLHVFCFDNRIRSDAVVDICKSFHS